VHTARNVRLVKGSHIVVRKLFEHRFAYLFQNPDRRIGFALPYEREFTLLGTTDVEYRGEPQHAAASPEEIDYLCAMASRYFSRAVTRAQVVWSYCGVRPLLEDESADAAEVTRDYALDLDAAAGAAPLLSVFGGKITTYRKLAQDAVDRLAGALGRTTPGWTATATLPGGDLPESSFAVFTRAMEHRYPWLPTPLRRRYARAYGTRVQRMLQGARTLADLGSEVLPGLHELEIDYLRRQEWARSAQDILWRRTKLGLHLPAGSDAVLDAWLARRAAPLAV